MPEPIRAVADKLAAAAGTAHPTEADTMRQSAFSNAA